MVQVNFADGVSSIVGAATVLMLSAAEIEKVKKHYTKK